MPTAPKQTKFEAFRQVLWNPRNKTVLGRTGNSWAKLVLFYITLYSCLATIWTIFFCIFKQTISDKYPKWQLEESIIGVNPGLGFRPNSHHVDSALIRYSTNDDATGNMNYSVSELSKFLSSYKEEEQESCAHNEHETCRFSTKALIDTGCSIANLNDSYKQGKPCVLVKLNKIYGWKPIPYTNTPPNFNPDDTFVPNTIPITCRGLYDEDKERIGELKYYPPGIDIKYYPYYNQKDYLSPFVMVQFLNPSQNTLIYVECKTWLQNVRQDRQSQSGVVTFELFVENKPTSINN